jgi:hypothetical protein
VSPLARILAVIAALTGIVVGLAGLVRAAALAADERVVWRLPQWWEDLDGGSASWVVGLVAAAVAVAAVAYLIVALRQLAPPRAPATFQVGGAQVKVAGLERLVATRLGAEIPGLAPVRVQVTWAGQGWDVSALVDAPADDLVGVRDRAVRVAGAELSRATGGALAGLDLEVRRFVGPAA